MNDLKEVTACLSLSSHSQLLEKLFCGFNVFYFRKLDVEVMQAYQVNFAWNCITCDQTYLISNTYNMIILIFYWWLISVNALMFPCIWSILVQIGACHHILSSHYLNQWWLIIDQTLKSTFWWNVTQNAAIFIQWNHFKIWFCGMSKNFQGPLFLCSSIQCILSTNIPSGSYGMKHWYQWPLLLTWFNFEVNRWSLGMDK